MKKALTLLLSCSLALVSLAGCSPKASTPAPSAPASAETPAPAENVSDETLKTGLAVISSTAKSSDAGEKDGLAQVDSTVVAVTVDKDGKIVDCVIDAAQTRINFSTAGELVTDVKAEFKTKKELAADYGMAKASGIGKEWNEQAAAFAEFVVGKTVEEVKGIAVNEKGAPSDADLASSVTISIGGYVAAIEKAVANAQDLGAKAGDKLGLGIVTNIAKSKNAGDEDGVAQAYSTYGVVTFDAEGKITSCILEGSQTNVKFSKEGKITSDINGAYKTKTELGADYGMAKVSGIGKEWFEQAAAFAAYAVGKTTEEVKGIAMNEKTAPTGDDLTGSVTVSVGDFIAVIEKASTATK